MTDCQRNVVGGRRSLGISVASVARFAAAVKEYCGVVGSEWIVYDEHVGSANHRTPQFMPTS